MARKNGTKNRWTPDETKMNHRQQAMMNLRKVKKREEEAETRLIPHPVKGYIVKQIK